MSTRPNLAAQTGPSSTIWGHMPYEVAPDLYYGHMEHFANFDQTTGLCGPGGGLVIDAGSSVALQTDQVGGVLRLTTQNVDADSVTWVTGDNTAGFGKFTAGKKIAFECRIKPTQIVTQDLCIGLASEALAASTSLIADADTQADVDFVGFVALAATPSVLNAVFNTASGGGITTVKTTAQTMVAGTWYRLGVYCDGTRVTWFVNGLPITSTAIVHPVPITRANFPDGEELAAYIQIQATTTTAVSVDVDWANWAMEL